MTEYSNENKGAIWGNKKKTTDNHPDYTGSLNVDGVEYWVSGWKRKPSAKPNAHAMSIAITPKEGAANSFKKEQSAPAQSQDDFDMDIPF